MNRGAQLLAQWREEHDVTQMELCVRLKRAAPTVISHLEHGRRLPNRTLAVEIEAMTGGAVPVEAWDQPAVDEPKAA